MLAAMLRVFMVTSTRVLRALRVQPFLACWHVGAKVRPRLGHIYNVKQLAVGAESNGAISRHGAELITGSVSSFYRIETREVDTLV